MKKLLSITLFTVLVISVQAQLRLAVEGDATISEKLGIGINDPLEKIHIYDGNLALEWPDQPIDQGKLYLMRTNIVNAANSSGYKFSWRNDDGSARKDAIYFDRNGDVYFPGLSKVGIGTNNPSASLEVVGDTKILGRLEVRQPSVSGSVFIGDAAGYSNTSGSQNTFLGALAGVNNTTGSHNTFLGRSAGYSNTTSSSNTCVGSDAGGGLLGNSNTFLGKSAGFFTGGGNELTALGANAVAIACCNLTEPTPVNNAFTIGSHSLITASHSGVLGNITMQKVGGYVNWGTASDGRMKTAVQEDVKGLDFILQLRPVSYQVDALKMDRFLRKGMEEVTSAKNRSDAEKAAETRRRETYEGYLREKSQIRYTGFIAQEVERAAEQADFEFSGVVKPDHEQDHYSLRYAEFVVPLVKGMQEQQKIIAALEEKIKETDQLKQEVAALKLLVEKLLKEDQEQDAEGSSYVLPLKDQDKAMLAQNRPNPFGENTIIDYYIPGDVTTAKIRITAADGKELGVVHILEAGPGQVTIRTGAFPAGTYFYSLVLDGQVFETKKMVRIR